MAAVSRAGELPVDDSTLASCHASALGLGDLHTLLDSQPNQVGLELGDPRCADALALLESKRLPDGGFPLEEPNAATADRVASRHSYAKWGPSGQRQSNPLISLTALGVLQAATQRGW